MRILVVSDIHANLAALEAVMAHAEGRWDELWCLGDVVGYGPNPNECVELISREAAICLAGNHDWAALGKLDIDDFNAEAKKAVYWTQDVLSDESRNFLDSLPSLHTLEEFTLAHGSPRQPVWEYIFDYETALENFAHFSTPYCLVGHTHVPIMIAENEGQELEVASPIYDETVNLQGTRLIINPGSVGQPRDADPRAAYAFLDTSLRTWEFYRVKYPVEQTQDLMRQFDLPEALVVRLSYGW